MRFDSKSRLTLLAGLVAASAFAQTPAPRDQFFWLGEMNKASVVINTDEGLLDKALAPKIAAGHAQTIVSNCTNGAAAQPNSLGHQLLGFVAGFERDAQRMREACARIDRSPMGTTVLNGSSWPLHRTRMAQYLGFAAVVDNAYDTAQIASLDFRWAEARRIFREGQKHYTGMAALPMSEQEFRSTLDPVALVQNRRTVGGPQMPEMRRMLTLAKQQLAEQNKWIHAERATIEYARAKLNRDFSKLLVP